MCSPIAISEHSTPKEESVATEQNTFTENEAEKIPLVRLCDYVNYNAHYLTEEPRHDHSTSIPKSESTFNISESTIPSCKLYL